MRKRVSGSSTAKTKFCVFKDSQEKLFATVVVAARLYSEGSRSVRGLSHNSGTHFFLRGMNGARNVKFGMCVEGTVRNSWMQTWSR